MVNHIRTLLLNKSGGKQNLGLLGEEYIPENFKAQTLPPWIKNYLNVLFGSKPEPIYQNFVIDRLLRVIHSTKYKDYVLLFDKRLTYDLDQESPFFNIRNDLNIEGNAQAEIALVEGDLTVDHSRGILLREWQVSITNGAIYIRNLLTNESTSFLIFNNSTLSLPFPLVGTKAKARITLATKDLFGWNFSGKIWHYSKFDRELEDFIDEINNLRGNIFRLFGRDGKEPFKTFFNLWNSSNYAEKLTGFLLALAWRLEENRVSNGG